MINQTLATTAFNTTGLAALGSASAQLSATWADGSVSHQDEDMSLELGTASTWRAPIDGHLAWSKPGAPHLSDRTGAPLSGPVAVLRFHPQGALRLKRLVAARYSTDGAHDRPTPFYAAIRDGNAPAGLPNGEPAPPKSAGAGESLETHGRLTFHDERGLIIDPVAVACIMNDLLAAFPALLRSGSGSASGSGGVAEIAGSAGPDDSVRLHLVDLFGKPWVDHADRDGVSVDGDRLAAGPHEWSGDLEVTDTSGSVRIARLPDGSLSTDAIAVPTLPSTGSAPPELERQFFRVAVVDLELHLTGNRRADPGDGSETPPDSVPWADEATAAEQPPAIGTGDITVLPNGRDLLGAAGEIAGLSGTRLAVSPTIADDFALPGGVGERWPQVPAPAGTAEALTGDHMTSAREEATAAYIGDTPDVVVTWPAGALPAEAFVRIFPRVDPGRATVPLAQLRFSKRGDGGGAIVPSGGECSVRVPDPFQSGEGPRPSAPTLVFDLLVVTRESDVTDARLLGAVEVGPVGEGGTAPAEAIGPNALDGIADDHRGISLAPVLGLEQAESMTVTDLLVTTVGASTPRQSPRFATMARTETIVAGHDGASPGEWTSLIGAGFLTGDSLNGDARLGSPGLPAGPEEHAPGLRVTGSLAQHLARAALRRTHHLATRLPELDDGRWAPVTGGAGNATGAVLQSVAPTVESSELRLALSSELAETLPETWPELVAAVQDRLDELPTQLSSLLQNATPDAGDRWVAEFKREAESAHHGRRDAQWSWRWALSHARELVYIETSLLSATAEGTGADKVDLVQLLGERLDAERNLHVVLVTPRRVPFGPGYEPFAYRMYHGRNEAVDGLTREYGKRVVAYHPVGFPGRPEMLRGTFAVVDDVWALMGGSTFSRRGLTFDGSVDVAFVGHDLRDGVSATVRDARRSAMGRVLGVGPLESGSTATPDPRWTQLAGRRSAFELMRRMVANGGEGEVQPKWPGLEEAETLALSKAIADPEGKEYAGAHEGLPTSLALLAAINAALAALDTGDY